MTADQKKDPVEILDGLLQSSHRTLAILRKQEELLRGIHKATREASRYVGCIVLVILFALLGGCTVTFFVWSST